MRMMELTLRSNAGDFVIEEGSRGLGVGDEGFVGVDGGDHFSKSIT